jgi:hypothetical protein
VVTGTISHHVPREMAERVMFVRTSLRRSSVIFRAILGSKNQPSASF